MVEEFLPHVLVNLVEVGSAHVDPCSVDHFDSLFDRGWELLGLVIVMSFFLDLDFWCGVWLRVEISRGVKAAGFDLFLVLSSAKSL